MLFPDPTKSQAWNLRRRERILAEITVRELEFIHWVCHPDEHPYKRIAELKGVSAHTVEGNIKELKRKLGISSKTGLCLFAMAWGLVPGYAWVHGAEQLDAGADAREGEEVPAL